MTPESAHAGKRNHQIPAKEWRRAFKVKLSDKNKAIIGLLARIIAGAVFLYAGFLKAMAPSEEFAYAIEAYKVFPSFIITISAITMPWVEIYLGIFLIIGLFTRISSIMMGLLFIFFELLILSALARGISLENCGCFGSAYSNSMEFELFFNLIIICLVFIAYKFRGKFSLDNLMQKKVMAAK